MTEPTPASCAKTARESLDLALADLEARVKGVSTALRSADAQALECAAAQLQASLLPSMAQLRTLPAYDRAVVAMARRRLELAAAELASQREAVARATGALERAAGVLWPQGGGAYGANGTGVRAMSSGSLVA